MRSLPPRRAWYWALLLALGAVLVSTWAGCGTPRERYRILSMFFDGVPDPDAPPEDENARWRRASNPGAATQPARLVSHHKPYTENKCTECHTGMPAGGGGGPVQFSLSTLDAKLCRKCHEQVPRQHLVMHGPVAAEACLWCHTAHESPEPSLLKAAPPGLCLQCHERPALTTKEPAHQDLKRNCLDCHMGHGGPKRFFLRDQPKPAPTTAPATVPAMTPAAVAPREARL